MSALQDKVVVVTGSTRGIGAEIALECGRRSASVVVSGRNEELLKAMAGELEGMNVPFFAIKADIGKAEDAKKLIDQAVEKFGKLDILVNNAGITRDNLLMRMSEEEWNAVIETNLTGTFNCIKAATRQLMKQRYGRIINITSVVGQMGNAGQANYSASKAGIIGLTKSVARELASRNVTCNAIAPGFIQTDMTGALNDDVVAKLKSQIPLSRLGTVADVAKAVCFLASDDAAYITGQVLNVDGGMVM